MAEGDSFWGLKWGRIDSSLQVFVIGNVKIIYGILSVLMGVLLRDIFPDPDTICRQLKYYQYEACKWFCELTVLTARDGELLHDEVKDAETREEMMNSIRQRPRMELLHGPRPY